MNSPVKSLKVHWLYRSNDNALSTESDQHRPVQHWTSYLGWYIPVVTKTI